MRFSLRTLLIIVLLAAIFAAAFVYRTPTWVVIVVDVVIAILCFGVIGLCLGKLHRHFWIPFCVVGWSYLLMAYSDYGFQGVGRFLPGSHVSLALWRALYGTLPFVELEWLYGRPAPLVAHVDFLLFHYLIQAISLLACAALAGIVTVLLLRPKQQPSPP